MLSDSQRTMGDRKFGKIAPLFRGYTGCSHRGPTVAVADGEHDGTFLLTSSRRCEERVAA
jgi:hypothetical protein